MTVPAGREGRRPATLTAVPGVRVGHAEVSGGRSGCTVILGPFRGAVEMAGMATGSRELPVLAPDHVVPKVDALLLTGGSAWGLAAADGVMAWLGERGLGYRTAGDVLVPIVPAGVIYDLAPGVERPDAGLGRAACDSAGEGPVGEGRVGAGAGATVGKILGPGTGRPGGVGSFALRAGRYHVGALAVVNALGDVMDRQGRIVEGARGPKNELVDAGRFLREGGRPGELGSAGGAGGGEAVGGRGEPGPGENTTLAAVATDAPLSRVDLGRVARMAATAIPRRIVPAHTPFDGDLTFVLSTAPEDAPLPAREVLTLGSVARDALEEAILRAVEAGSEGSAGGRRLA